ncbi:MAG: hypothetical protein R3F42_09325 [Pseudomonadota bacterium]
MKLHNTGLPRLAQAAIAIATSTLAAGTPAATVISEVLYDAAGTDRGNVFVELYGVPGSPLTGLTLEGVNGTDGGVYKSAELSGVFPADGVFVIGDDSGDGSSLVANVDLVLDVEFQNGPDSIVLRDVNGIVDALGYGDFTAASFAGEGAAAPDVAAGWSLARVDVRLDSNDNSVDFFGLELPTPGLVPASTVPVPPALALFLSGCAGLVGIARRRS